MSDAWKGAVFKMTRTRKTGRYLMLKNIIRLPYVPQATTKNRFQRNSTGKSLSGFLPFIVTSVEPNIKWDIPRKRSRSYRFTLFYCAVILSRVLANTSVVKKSFIKMRAFALADNDEKHEVLVASTLFSYSSSGLFSPDSPSMGI